MARGIMLGAMRATICSLILTAISLSGVRAQMEEQLTAWMKRTGDAWTFNSREPVDDKGRLYRFGTFATVEEYLRWEAAHPDLAPKD